MITLSAITIYPVKSMAGISLTSSKLATTGLSYDRRWMVVSTAGKFITQRTHPQMALIQPQVDNGQLILSYKRGNEHFVPQVDTEKHSVMMVQVWQDTVQAQLISSDTDRWLAQIIGEPCHLVYMADDEIRACDLSYAQQGDRTSFADGFPLLVISQASLDDLNTKLNQPMSMQRFRPNFVVEGCEAFAEDTWQTIQINTVAFRVVKPCSRCIITTIDPTTGKKTSAEPLKTLATYRKQGNKVMFGQNIIHNGLGICTVGDEVQLLI
jgi:uncharacterized protein YcbX